MSASITEMREKVDRYRGAIKRAKEQTEVITKRALHAGVVVASSAAVGAARGKWGEGPNRALKIPKTQIDADLAVGVVTGLAGVAGLGGSQSDVLASVGAGVLGGVACLAAFNATQG